MNKKLIAEIKENQFLPWYTIDVITKLIKNGIVSGLENVDDECIVVDFNMEFNENQYFLTCSNHVMVLSTNSDQDQQWSYNIADLIELKVSETKISKLIRQRLVESAAEQD